MKISDCNTMTRQQLIRAMQKNRITLTSEFVCPNCGSDCFIYFNNSVIIECSGLRTCEKRQAFILQDQSFDEKLVYCDN